MAANKVRMRVAMSKLKRVMNGAGICLYGCTLGLSRVPLFAWLNAVTSWRMTPARLCRTRADATATRLPRSRKLAGVNTQPPLWP